MTAHARQIEAEKRAAHALVMRNKRAYDNARLYKRTGYKTPEQLQRAANDAEIVKGFLMIPVRKK